MALVSEHFWFFGFVCFFSHHQKSQANTVTPSSRVVAHSIRTAHQLHDWFLTTLRNLIQPSKNVLRNPNVCAGEHVSRVHMDGVDQVVLVAMGINTNQKVVKMRVRHAPLAKNHCEGP